MKRFWLFGLFLACALVALNAPAFAKDAMADSQSSDDMSDQLDDINSALGSMAVKMNEMDSKFGLTIFGDVRARYAVWSQNQSYKGAGVLPISDKAVGRYRARLGAKESFGDVTGGLRLSTGSSTNPNSENQTYDNGFGNGGVFVDQAFLTYQPSYLDKMVKLTVGKMGNPLDATPMTWDPDINPEGAALEISKGDTKFLATYFDLVNTAGTAQTSTNTGTATDEFMADFQLSQMLKLDDNTTVKAMLGFEDIPYANSLAQGFTAQPPGYVGPGSPLATSNTPLGAGNILNDSKYLPGFQVGEAMLVLKNNFGDVPMQWTAHVADNFNSFNVPINETLTGPSAVAGYSKLSNQLGWYLEAKAGDTKKGDFLGCLAASYVEPNAQLANLASDDANFTNTEYLFEQVGYGLEKNVSLLLSAWEIQRIYYGYYGNAASTSNITSKSGTSRDPLFQLYADCVLSL